MLCWNNESSSQLILWNLVHVWLRINLSILIFPYHFQFHLQSTEIHLWATSLHSFRCMLRASHGAEYEKKRYTNLCFYKNTETITLPHHRDANAVPRQTETGKRQHLAVPRYFCKHFKCLALVLSARFYACWKLLT